ncbi:MAG: carboxypeptidase regulatory-like domain-containing protein [Armatimonadetes bacterium]|nr:carboxypeptidase regulatory-like domain-containing protein [Armatimonadota bacterium]
MIRISRIKGLLRGAMAGVFCIAFFTSCGGGSGGSSSFTAGQTSSSSPSGSGGAIEGTLYAPGGSGSKVDSKDRVFRAPDNLAPVPAATIMIAGTDLQAQSNLRGYFFFPQVPPGLHTLLVKSPGFPDYRCPVKVQKGGLVTLGPPNEGYVDITTASLFGKTRLSNGLTLSGTDILVNDVSTGQASDDKGECIFYNIPPGNVKITARHNLGQGWLALYRTVNVTVSCAQGQIAEPSIVLPINTGNGFTGRITAKGKPVSGVTMSYQGLASGSVKTDANGEYRIVGVPEGTYTLTPSGSGFSFEPSSFQITVLNLEDQPPGGRATLEAIILGPPPDRANISGTITYGGSGLSGVTVTLTGTANGVTTTNASGSYVFTNLGNGNYTVTPSHPSYSFTPTSRNVVIFFGIPLPSAANFTATKILFDISGTLIDQGTGLPIPNATVTWGANSSVSDGSGNYVITGCANGTNNLVATHPSYSFVPSGFTNPVTVSGAEAFPMGAILPLLPTPITPSPPPGVGAIRL